MAKIPSTDRVEDAVLHFPVRPERFGMLRLPRDVIEEKRDPVTGERVLQARWETVDEWIAQNDPEGQQARLMNEVRG